MFQFCFIFEVISFHLYLWHQNNNKRCLHCPLFLSLVDSDWILWLIDSKTRADFLGVLLRVIDQLFHQILPLPANGFSQQCANCIHWSATTMWTLCKCQKCVQCWQWLITTEILIQYCILKMVERYVKMSPEWRTQKSLTLLPYYISWILFMNIYAEAEWHNVCNLWGQDVVNDCE